MPVKPATQCANPSSRVLTIGDAVYDLDHHTPMMVQYLTMKVNYPQALLLYRMGDFYELFFDDAKRAAQILDITLTRRGTDKSGNTIAMAGVPFHAADSYMARLIAAGQTVVVCEQIDESMPNDLPERGAKSNKNSTPSTSSYSATSKPSTIMRREVVKTLTAGTITDDELITEGATPTVVALDIASVAKNKPPLQAAVSQLDLAAGTLTTQTLNATHLNELQAQILTVFARFAPSECIVSEAISESWLAWLRGHIDCPIIEVAANDFYADHAPTTLCQQFDVQRLDGLGILDLPLAQTSCAALIHYARQTQQRHVPQVNQLIVERDDDYLIIDANSQQNLELFVPASSYGTSLLSVVNHCKTPMGKRLLVQQMKRPLRQHSRINQRLDAIDSLLNNSYNSHTTLVDDLREILSAIGDIERISSRIGLMSARPRDLRKLFDGIASSQELNALLVTADITAAHKGLLPLLMQHLPMQLPAIGQIAERIEQAIVIEPPAHIRDGGMIAKGFDDEFDRLSHLHDNIQIMLDEMADTERQAHQLTSLKVGFNKVSGFYFELPKMHAQNAPQHFIRRQTLKSSERFITDELKTLETEYLSAQTLALAREKQLYQQLLATLSCHLSELQQFSSTIAQLDVLSNWAQLAASYNWQRPIMGNQATSSGTDHILHRNANPQNQLDFNNPLSLSNPTAQSAQSSIDIKAGRHVVVEAALNPIKLSNKATIRSKPHHTFVANDCQLGLCNSEGYNDRLLMITGPNMGGKSTYMRQTALIVLLAHTGSFVPAEQARIGDIDRIFTRIGSADDLAGGKSTFMVEMIETANILNLATDKSLVLMDEVGRGTATTDGLAIAHACVNKLLDIGCLTLFATHYFELTQLADSVVNTDSHRTTGIRNVHVAASEVDGQLLLLHQIREGAASSSFGLHVAKMAGIPKAVLADAQRYLIDSTVDNKNDLANSVNDKREQRYSDDAHNNAHAVNEPALSTITNNKQNQLLKLEQTIATLNPDSLTPKQAHDMLYMLKQLISC